MLEMTQERKEELSKEYGVEIELLDDVIDATNSFQFIPDDEEREEFVEGVVLNYIVGNMHNTNPRMITRGVGDVIADAAYDCYHHNISPNDEIVIERVRTKYENIK